MRRYPCGCAMLFIGRLVLIAPVLHSLLGSFPVPSLVYPFIAFQNEMILYQHEPAPSSLNPP